MTLVTVRENWKRCEKMDRVIIDTPAWTVVWYDLFSGKPHFKFHADQNAKRA